MPKLTTNEKVMFVKPRKRYGFSQLFGTSFFGYIRFGEYNPYAGIFQYRNSAKQRYHVKTSFYWPRNPRTVPQQSWREVFALGAIAWSSLTAPEKEQYNIRARAKHMTGYHLFQREWLSSH